MTLTCRLDDFVERLKSKDVGRAAGLQHRHPDICPAHGEPVEPFIAASSESFDKLRMNGFTLPTRKHEPDHKQKCSLIHAQVQSLL